MLKDIPLRLRLMAFGHSFGDLMVSSSQTTLVRATTYYYVNEQGKDNYLDIVQNISRNFTNPQLMRDRVVNKTYCSPLPQKGKE